MRTTINYLKCTMLLCLSLGLRPLASAQSLRIQYDFIKDELTYFRTKPGDKIGVEISSPIVGRNKMVQVEVVNFNKFVYTGNSIFTSKLVADQSDMSLMSIITPLVMPAGSGSFFSALGGKLPTEVPRGGLLSSRDAADAYDEVVSAYNALEALQNSFKNMDYVIKKLNALKYNAYLPTDSITAMSDKLVQLIFKKTNVTTSDFSNTIVNFNNQYTQTVNNLQIASGNFLRAYKAYAADFAGQDFDGKGLDSKVQKYTESGAISDEAALSYITNRIDLLETIYTSIKSSSFSFSASQAAKDDQIDLTLQFYKNPEAKDSAGPAFVNLNNLGALSLIKEKRINITVRGDMKMSTSVGLGFPTFGNTQTYFNKDSIITGQETSNYTPNLAAYVNFYAYTGRVANLGGSFGIGVPLNDPSRTVNMFLGGAALFGTHDRVALHGGLTLGQVKNLGQGYQVGEKLLTATQEIPLRTDWEWGGFVGISFTLNKGS